MERARRWLSLVAAVFVIASALPPGGAAPFPSAPSPTFATEIIGGQTWLYDTRATDNAVDDDEAQVAVDANRSVELLWRQQTGGNGSYYYARFGRVGEPIQNATFITANVSAYGPVGGPRGSSAGIDSNQHIHVTFEDGPYNISYEQFNASGGLLVGPKRVGPADAQVSRRPALAVGLDDTVHMAHGEYKFQCEDIAYDKLANDGSVIWNDRIVSADVSAMKDNGIIRADRYSGNFLFTFGSDHGSWLGRFDKFGVNNLGSVKFRNQTDGTSADVAAAPDGSMHVVWQDAGNLQYTVVDATGAKVVDGRVLVANGTVGSFPKVAAASDGRVFVVWQDNRTGASQIMYGEIPADGNLNAFVPFMLTRSSGSAFDPSIALDPDDSPVVAWTDTRDGDREIFFKRAFVCGGELYGPPYDLNGGDILHPNQTYVTPLALKNKGVLPDSFVLDLTYTPGAFALGWAVSINATYVDNLGGGEVANISLTIHAPANAKTGDNIAVHVNASSITWPDCFDRIDLYAFVRVVRGLSLSWNVSLQAADNGETVTFSMFATNKGDLREDGIVVRSGEKFAPMGWAVTTDRSTLSLDPRETASFTVFVTVPNETWLAPANFLARIGVIVESSADMSVSSAKEVFVQVKARLNLTLEAGPESQSAPPGSYITFTVNISNLGNMGSPAQINLEVQPQVLEGWRASLDTETAYLAGDESTSVKLRVVVSPRAVAGERVNLTLSALAVRFGAFVQTSVSVTAASACGVTLGTPSDLSFVGGVARTLSLAGENTGNTPSNVSLRIVEAPGGWQVSHAGAAGSVASQRIPAFEVFTFDLLVTPPAAPAAGIYMLSLGLANDLCGASIFSLPLVVGAVRGTEFWADNGSAAVEAGGQTTVDLHVKNTGNIGTAFFLSATDLPAGFQAWFVLLGSDGQTEYPTSINGGLLLDPFSEVEVRLHLQAPATAVVDTLTATVRGETENGNVTEILVAVEILRPDLRVLSAAAPSSFAPGQIAMIEVVVDNKGTAAAPPGFLRAFVDGFLFHTQRFAPLAPGQPVSLYVPWSAELGPHVIRFEVVPGKIPADRDPTNGWREIAVVVREEVTPSPVPSPDYTMAAISVVGGAAMLAVLLWPKRKPPPPRAPPGVGPQSLPRNPKKPPRNQRHNAHLLRCQPRPEARRACPRLLVAGDRRQDALARVLQGQARPRRLLLVQPLPLRPGGRGPDDRLPARLRTAGRRPRCHQPERRGGVPGRFLRRDEAACQSARLQLHVPARPVPESGARLRRGVHA